MFINEMYPFAKANEMGAKFVMAAHISAPQIVGDNTPSSLSKVMLTDVLREKIGYKGIIITYADMLLMPDDFEKAYQGMLNAVQNGIITQVRLDESVSRILKVKMEI